MTASGNFAANSSTNRADVFGESLEDIQIPSAAVHSLIEEYVSDRLHVTNSTLTNPSRYFDHYHEYFPILPDKSIFIAEHRANRLLLWTVMAIASQSHHDLPNLYASLVDPGRRLAADIYSPQSRSLRTMQALLLLCVWPFPFQQTINDPSPMYCSLATHVGYQLGLHRPSFRGDFDEQVTERTTSTCVDRKTWYGCFIVNQG